MKKALVWFILFWFGLHFARAQDTTVVSTDSISINFHCICKGLFKSKDDLDSYKTKIDNDYKELLMRYKTAENPCENYVFPNIDFSKNNLVAYTIFASGCSHKKQCVLFKIASQKKYLFVVTITEIGICKPIFPVPIYLLTPKLENGYSFEYKTLNNKISQ